MTAADSTLVSAAQLLDARIGLKPGVSFRPRLARAVRDVAEAMNMDREELVGALSTNALLFEALLDRVTVQESGFFRHPEQFEYLERMVLPTIKTPLRAWSAACANGQEAYSLAMVMSECRGAGTVFASDVSPAALHRTVTGSYVEREMAGVSLDRRRQHFLPAPGSWQAKQNLREMVKVQRHNLLDPIPRQVASCHVVMCRNVLIYFEQRHAELFLERLADAMDPAACLFVGASETIWQMTDRFEPSRVGLTYVYRPLPHGSHRRPTPVIERAVVRTPPPVRPAVSVAKVRHAPEPIDETGEDSGRLGRQLLADGSLAQAVVAFRRWAYLSPDDPSAHFQLGSTLDASDERAPALRAYRAALAALDRGTPERLVDFLHGYDRVELRRLIVDRCLAASEAGS